MSRHGALLKMVVTGLLVFPPGMGYGVAATPAPAKTNAPFEVVRTGEFEGVIFPREADHTSLISFTGIQEQASWTPERKDVLALEEKIESYLKDAAPGDLWARIATYKRQYVGITRNGRRTIFVNFFCSIDSTDWKTGQLVSVDDGGDCFFHVLYEPGSATFSKLRINGEA